MTLLRKAYRRCGESRHGGIRRIGGIASAGHLRFIEVSVKFDEYLKDFIVISINFGVFSGEPSPSWHTISNQVELVMKVKTKKY